MAALASDPIVAGEPTSMQLDVPGGNPVWALPRDRQRQPVRAVNPTLVILEAVVKAQSFGCEEIPRASRKGRLGNKLQDGGIENIFI